MAVGLGFGGNSHPGGSKLQWWLCTWWALSTGCRVTWLAQSFRMIPGTLDSGVQGG